MGQTLCKIPGLFQDFSKKLTNPRTFQDFPGHFSNSRTFQDFPGPVATLLMSTMTFDDESTRAERWKFDRFTAVRGFLEMFNEECMSCLIACDYLSLDETL